LPRECDLVSRFASAVSRSAALGEGLEVSLGVSGLRRLAGGRLYLEVVAEAASGGRARVCSVLAFCGRGFYRPWIELFAFEAELRVGGARTRLAGSSVEAALYDAAARALGAGEPLYVEYIWDEETMNEVSRGVHPAFTRIGWELLKRGFTWFKLWYYPEGFMEGTEKIQAEKPVSEERRREHLRQLREEAYRLAASSVGRASLRAREFLGRW
jgi:hypothetical protein